MQDFCVMAPLISPPAPKRSVTCSFSLALMDEKEDTKSRDRKDTLLASSPMLRRTRSLYGWRKNAQGWREGVHEIRRRFSHHLMMVEEDHKCQENQPIRVFKNANAQPQEFVSVPSSCEALKSAVATLYNIEDFHLLKIGEGFFSEVFKVVHKSSGRVMVLKKNKHRANRSNMLKEVQLMNTLNHPNILRYEGACVHEAQLHALTEYINGGSLDQLISDEEEDWTVRISLALDVAKGMKYLHEKGYFHRDLTSKNILIRRDRPKISAVVGDFGLAAPLPKNNQQRLSQVGSPYWMSPECLTAQYYDGKSDVFSFGIVLCELIAWIDADPDILPRTENFGVDYVAFSKLVSQSCPTQFLKMAFSCVQIAPECRPTFAELVKSLKTLPKEDKAEKFTKTESTAQMRARLHFRHSSPLSLGEEMSLRDPFYVPSPGANGGSGTSAGAAGANPFAPLFPPSASRLKLLGSSGLLFCSCFEEASRNVEDAEKKVRKSVSLTHKRPEDISDDVLQKLQQSAVVS